MAAGGRGGGSGGGAGWGARGVLLALWTGVDGGVVAGSVLVGWGWVVESGAAVGAGRGIALSARWAGFSALAAGPAALPARGEGGGAGHSARAALARILRVAGRTRCTAGSRGGVACAGVAVRCGGDGMHGWTRAGVGGGGPPGGSGGVIN